MYLEKMKKWIAKAQEGNEKFGCIQKQAGNWTYVCRGMAYNIDTIYFCIRTKEQIFQEEYWERNVDIGNDGEITILLKDSQKLIFAAGINNVYGFGFGDVSPSKSIMLCFRVLGVMHIVWGDTTDRTIYEAYGCTENAEGSGMDGIFTFIRNATLDRKNVKGTMQDE